MKRIIAILLCVLLTFTLASCGKIGGKIVDAFEDNTDKSVQEIADAIVEAVDFELLTASVKEGLFDGFGSMPISGFDNAMLLTPADTSIPFVGYVFELSEDTDKNTFIGTLEKYADVGFKGEEEADSVIIESEDDKVIVIITPDKIEDKPQGEVPTEDKMVVAGEDFVDTFE